MAKLIAQPLVMENKKVSKKTLRSLINDSMRETISRLELPKPSKKVKKLIDKSSRKLASEFASILKKENKKKKSEVESLTYVEDILKGSKERKSKKGKLETIED
jgi:hypothetical protein